MSVIFEAAAAEWRRVREEYELHLEAQYARAVEECRCVLLNARGQAAGIDEFSLFKGPMRRARLYASEELLDFWTRHTRLTFEQFERIAFTWADDGR